jgi:hypothetical protein
MGRRNRAGPWLFDSFSGCRIWLPKKTYALTTAQLILCQACDNSLHLVVKKR